MFYKKILILSQQKCLFAQQKTAPSSQGTVSSAVLVVPYCGSITAYRYRQVPTGNPLHLLYTLREMFSMTAYKDNVHGSWYVKFSYVDWTGSPLHEVPTL